MLPQPEDRAQLLPLGMRGRGGANVFREHQTSCGRPRGRLTMASRRKNVPVYGLMAVIGLLPLLSVVLAGQIAAANGCGLHEGSVQPCMILGFDAGGILYTMTVLGWLMLVTNLALIAGVAGLLWEALRVVIRKSLQK